MHTHTSRRTIKRVQVITTHNQVQVIHPDLFAGLVLSVATYSIQCIMIQHVPNYHPPPVKRNEEIARTSMPKATQKRPQCVCRL